MFIPHHTHTHTHTPNQELLMQPHLPRFYHNNTSFVHMLVFNKYLILNMHSVNIKVYMASLSWLQFRCVSWWMILEEDDSLTSYWKHHRQSVWLPKVCRMYASVCCMSTKFVAPWRWPHPVTESCWSSASQIHCDRLDGKLRAHYDICTEHVWHV